MLLGRRRKHNVSQAPPAGTWVAVPLTYWSGGGGDNMHHEVIQLKRHCTGLPRADPARCILWLGHKPS
jgi:hypothetical protein